MPSQQKDLFPILVDEQLGFHYARLLSTRPGFLEDWLTEYNGYEINEPEEENPVAIAYAELVDRVRKKQNVNLEPLVTAVCEGVLAKAVSTYPKAKVAHQMQYADTPNAPTISLDSHLRKQRTFVLDEFKAIDAWFNEHLVSKLLEPSDTAV